MQTVRAAAGVNQDRRSLARRIRDTEVGRVARLRGVIEFTNVCHHNCTYCGMRSANTELVRYTLGRESLVALAGKVAADSVGTVMIQGGDHLQYDVSQLCDAVRAIREGLGRTVLLCLGDRPVEDYEHLYAAGATQAIVKFETSNEQLYRKMRPHSHLAGRLELIRALANIGYQVSSGFIIGLPGTAQEDLERDLNLISELPLFAASVSPFIPNDQSPLAGKAAPGLERVLDCIAEIRIRNPRLWIPSVSALNLLAGIEGRADSGQLLGLMAGANVLTINYTPPAQQKSYLIYSSGRSIVEIEHAVRAAELAGLEVN